MNAFTGYSSLYKEGMDYKMRLCCAVNLLKSSFLPVIFINIQKVVCTFNEPLKKSN